MRAGKTRRRRDAAYRFHLRCWNNSVFPAVAAKKIAVAQAKLTSIGAAAHNADAARRIEGKRNGEASGSSEGTLCGHGWLPRSASRRVGFSLSRYSRLPLQRHRSRGERDRWLRCCRADWIVRIAGECDRSI